MKVALIAPTLNEIDGIREVFPKLAKLKGNVLDEIIVADLNSTDGTIEYSKDCGFQVHHQQSPGYGAAFMEALELTDADIIIDNNDFRNRKIKSLPRMLSP